MAAKNMPPESPFFVYVLRNDAGTTYTGIAKDIDARLAAHNEGNGAKFTRGRGPWAVIHTEGPLPHGDALRRETAIKRDRAFKAKLKERAGLKPAPTVQLHVPCRGASTTRPQFCLRSMRAINPVR